MHLKEIKSELKDAFDQLDKIDMSDFPKAALDEINNELTEIENFIRAKLARR